MSTAMRGASTAGRMTLATRLCHWTAWLPAAASIAPITPPISACDELDGIPKNQVSRFHTIAPVRPAATTVSVTSLVSTRPLAIVAATARDRNAPTRLSAPDRATAIRGRSAPVAIVVAIALPVSWKPLVKSKARAVITTRPSTTSLPTSSGSRPASLASRSWKQRSTDIRLRFDLYSSSVHLGDGGEQPDGVRQVACGSPCCSHSGRMPPGEAAVEVGQGTGQQPVRAVAGLRKRFLAVGAAEPAGGEQQARDGLREVTSCQQDLEPGWQL